MSDVSVRELWEEQGFVVLPSFLSRTDLQPVWDELSEMYPSANDFHTDVDPELNAQFRGDQFLGQRDFVFASRALNRLVVHPKLVELAERILATPDIRIYAAESWAKYAGAADYEQELHRDNHSPLVPSSDVAFRQVELFVHLSDVTTSDGPPKFVSRQATTHLPSDRYAYSREDHEDLYAAEQSGVGPAGTIIAWSVDTIHRATNVTTPGGARFTLHVNFRRADNEWFSRHAWGDKSYGEGWNEFVEASSPRELALFGFPPPGHAYWTPDVIERTRTRYPQLDLHSWEAAL